MVLRPNDLSSPDWQLVCPAYVEGMMQGELWNEELDLQLIQIR